MLDLIQLLKVPHIDNTLRFDLSPDGQSAVFSWNKTGKWELSEIRGKEIRKLEGWIEGAKFSPRFSPDGSKIAYACDIDGSESYHIAIHDLKSDVSTDYTPFIDYAHQPNFAWSPDGRTLAVLSDEQGQFALYLLSTERIQKKLLLDVRRPIWDVAWSPDGKYIAAEAEWTASDRTIYIVDVNGKETFQLKLGNEILNVQHPAWSPDSKSLAFSGENGEWHDIGLFHIETKEITWVNQSTGDDTQPAWSHDGKHIGWIHAEGARTNFQLCAEPCRNASTPSTSFWRKVIRAERSVVLRLQGVSKGRSVHVIKEYKIGAGVHYFPQFTSNSVLILYEDVSHPCDLWKISLKDGSIQQLTNSLPDELRTAEFIQPEEVWYAGKDGAQVPALLYRTKNAGDNSPAIVNIHGGPNWYFSFLWDPIMSHMASRGWAVLAPNYRGSTGYGKKWQNASRYDMGGVDTDDCAAGVKYLIENRLADKNKIAVTGRSHGGYLTMTCLTMYPELWAAGSAVVPFLNWLKSHDNSREDLQHWNIENMGNPEENRELWISRSPYFFLDKVNAPVQIICGGNDPRCPASESLDAHDKLVELRKKAELLLYEGEGHSFLDSENLIDSELKRMEFLEKVLE
jgi:dipeptidyl aminopeptidase/acylaminoacyl peptidase